MVTCAAAHPGASRTATPSSRTVTGETGISVKLRGCRCLEPGYGLRHRRGYTPRPRQRPRVSACYFCTDWSAISKRHLYDRARTGTLPPRATCRVPAARAAKSPARWVPTPRTSRARERIIHCAAPGLAARWLASFTLRSAVCLPSHAMRAAALVGPVFHCTLASAAHNWTATVPPGEHTGAHAPWSSSRLASRGACRVWGPLAATRRAAARADVPRCRGANCCTFTDQAHIGAVSAADPVAALRHAVGSVASRGRPPAAIDAAMPQAWSPIRKRCPTGAGVMRVHGGCMPDWCVHWSLNVAADVSSCIQPSSSPAI